MCGIFGMISKKARPFNKRAFCTMGVRNDSRGGDSCGVFIDGYVEYGVDDKKTFMSFFRNSILLETTTECKIALGHCRKASVGKVALETAQPVVLFNDNGDAEFVLIHNGTIYNYKELAKKYIPDVDIEGLTDSQVMARIFYYKGYDCLDEYNGGAVFVIHDYRCNKSFVFKGSSKKYAYSKEAEEERPLYYCWHNGRFVFSSIFETVYAFYYEEKVYNFPPNKLVCVKDGNKLKVVKEYNREKCTQSKPTAVSSYYGVYSGRTIWDEYDCYGYSEYYKEISKSFSLKFDGIHYTDDKNVPMHGVFFVSSAGYVYPNKKQKEAWTEEVAFFKGTMLKSPKAFKLIEDKFKEAGEQFTPAIEELIHMMDFNPHSDDLEQYYWYDEEFNLIFPSGEWKWPMASWSCTFNIEGKVTGVGKVNYYGWTKDYNMFTYDEKQILEAWKKICVEV